MRRRSPRSCGGSTGCRWRSSWPPRRSPRWASRIWPSRSTLHSGRRLGGLARRGGEPRHRTLRAAIEWSERLLPHDAREALAQWTVFAGAVRRSDAQAVLQVAPDVIDELARRSLLSVEIHSGRTYYGMLKTVRSVVGSASDSHRTQASGVLRRRGRAGGGRAADTRGTRGASPDR